MGSSATRSKQRWCSKNYTQVKISVVPDIAAAFKEACTASNVSMAGILSQFMSDYSGLVRSGGGGDNADRFEFSTRRKRRIAVKRVIRLLNSIREGELFSMDRVPDNLKGASSYESAEEIVSQLDETIETLELLY